MAGATTPKRTRGPVIVSQRDEQDEATQVIRSHHHGLVVAEQVLDRTPIQVEANQRPAVHLFGEANPPLGFEGGIILQFPETLMANEVRHSPAEFN